MNVIFIHQNFPSQYLHVVRDLASRRSNRVYFITQEDRLEIAGVQKLVYAPAMEARTQCHPYAAPMETAVRTGMAVLHALELLRDNGVVPDLIVGHCGWGETLFVKDVFPQTPLLTYFEFFYHAEGADVGFDREFSPSGYGDRARLKVRNAVSHLSFAESDWGHTATRWQRSLFPASMQSRIGVLHEGVDTLAVRPDPQAWLRLGRARKRLKRTDQVITFVARNLEPYRGFHTFMRALPAMQRSFPKAHAIVVGGDGLSYSDPPPYGSTWKEMMLAELDGTLDTSRIHFLGQVPYATYLNVLQVSSAHVYLTYPFVLSWSFLEAMAAGCLVIGSATQPVEEVLRDGENGLLVDFFSPQEIADRVEQVLTHPNRMRALRLAARRTVKERYDLRRVILPAWRQLLSDLAQGKLPKREPVTKGPGTEVIWR